MNEIIVSVIVPVYNVEKYVKKCLSSVLRQTFQGFELIVIDDGSKDKSGFICDSMSEKFKNIKVIHKENGGLSDARNTGLQFATGKYVVFLDSDDYWIDYDFIKAINDLYITRNPDLIIFGFEKIKDRKIIYTNIPKTDPSCNKFDSLVINGDYNICAWDKVIKRSILINNKIKFKKDVLSEDMEWCSNLFVYVNSCAILNRVVYAYRQRSGSISKSISLKNVEDVKNNYCACLKYKNTMSKNRRKLFDIYLSKNFSMFFIISSLLSKKERYDYLPFIHDNLYILKKSVRYREKLIFYFVNLVGIPFTMRIIREIYRIKRK